MKFVNLPSQLLVSDLVARFLDQWLFAYQWRENRNAREAKFSLQLVMLGLDVLEATQRADELIAAGDKAHRWSSCRAVLSGYTDQHIGLQRAFLITAIGRLITLMKRGKMWVGYCHLEIKTVPSRITILDYFNKTSKNNT